MKVYVLRNHSSYHDANIYVTGVFSTEEKANEFCTKNNFNLDNSNEHWYEIEEYVLDDVKVQWFN